MLTLMGPGPFQFRQLIHPVGVPRVVNLQQEILSIEISISVAIQNETGLYSGSLPSRRAEQSPHILFATKMVPTPE